MFTNDSYALLIGVDDYSTFDLSREQPVGTSDLLGSRNDVRTFWRLCRLLGIKPDHIRVLASPGLAYRELPGAGPENVAPATEAQILEKTAWLAEKLGHASRPTGILTYSGHGDWLAGQGLALCPSDVTWATDGLAHAVSFAALNALLGAHAENLTVVLDTCHSGMAAVAPVKGKTGKPLTLTGRTLASMPGAQVTGPTGHLPEIQPLVGRVLSAARRDQVAYQSMFDGHYRGVFSWAVSAAIEQWRVTQEKDNVRVDLSYAKLVETTQRLITALWFDQTPQLHGPAGVADVAVLHQGLVAAAGETAALPNGGFITEEIDPGGKDYLIYTLTNAGGGDVGLVLVTNTAGFGYDANREYWYMTTNLSNSAQVTFTGGTAQSWKRPPANLGTLSFTTVRTPSWTAGTSSGSMLAYSGTGGEYDGMNWQMSNTTGAWTGSITWWHNSTGNLFGAGNAWTLTPTSTSYSGYYYVSTPL